jgi:hypothetical protein
MSLFALEPVEDLRRGLVDQKEAAAEQDQVAPGDASAEDLEEGLGEPHHPGDREQQHETHAQREREAHPARQRLLFDGQPTGDQ